jgi:serine/threonine-protein kinase
MFSETAPVGRFRAAEAAGATATLPAVQQFAHFDLGPMLGRGGAGKVYQARNRRSGLTVALKLLDFQPLEPASDALKRLKREARVAASIVHPNIVRIFDLGVAEGVPFVEMELVSGVSLKERVRSEGPLEPAEAARLCTEALAGLARVHRERIVHGDVKPGNILIDDGGRARLTDFGLSTFLEETTSVSSGRLIGSPHFMAPEQWRGEAVDARTDLYAVGLVLYFALTGRLPYDVQNPGALMYKHLNEPLLEPGRSCPHLPEPLAAVIRRASRSALQYGKIRSWTSRKQE